MNLNFKKKLIAFFLFVNVCTVFAQNPPGKMSPDGIFDEVFDRFGNQYSLKDIQVSTLKSQTLCVSSGYFNVYFEIGSGFEQPGQSLRRNVLCQLFNDLSAFITPANVNQKVNIWVRDINTIIPNAGVSGVLGLASSFYTMPSGAPNVTGIVDGEVWKTIHAGQDSYINTASPLYTSGGQNLGFYHGMMAFNFSNPLFTNNWHTNLGTPTSAGFYDLYTVALHEMTHALGFASLIDANGSSKLSGYGFNYYSRYDMFLKTQTGQNLITNSGTCSLYNFSFNPVLNAGSVLTPPNANPNPCQTNTTTCASAVKFAGSVNQAVYTPNCFEGGSSLSHLEDQCHTPSAYNNDEYYVMSNAGGTGSAFMKRWFKEEEHKVLCDLGYSVGLSYGNALYSANFYNYTSGSCTGSVVAGINDGINNGFFTWQISVNGVATIPASAILANDPNANGFECLQDVYGLGTVNITSGNSLSTILYTGTASGTALLRYIPVNTTTGQRGNISYIFVRINSGNCFADPCNMITNGEFESVFPTCSAVLSNEINCWSSFSSNPELMGRFCPNWYQDIPCVKSNPASDTWNNGANNNDHFLGLFGFYFMDLDPINNSDNESVQTLLTSPLVPGNSYTLRFKAKVANDAGFLNIPANISICGSPNSMASIPSYNINDPNLSILIPSIIVPANNSWNSMSITFTYTGAAALNNFIMGYYANPTSTFSARYVYIDAVELYPAPAVPVFNPINPLCVGDVLNNLQQFADPGPGSFSGPNVSNNNGIYSFNALQVGAFEVVYSYTNDMGCTINTPAQIVVNSFATPTLAIAVSSTVNCIDTPVTLTVTGASNYTWVPAVNCVNTCSEVLITSLLPTIYTVTGSNGLACTSTKTIQIGGLMGSLCCVTPNSLIPDGANSSSFASLNNLIVDVAGVFNINSTANYVNVTFRMAPGSKIAVQPTYNLTLDNCKLFSCSDMWDGIYLNQSGSNAGGLIVMNATTIEDAIQGVVANCNNTSVAPLIKFVNSTMNKNYKNFQISNYTGSATYPLTFEQSTINCVSSVNSPGTNLKTPYASTRSSTGIFISNVKKIKVGNAALATYQNLFNNLNYGIYATKSDLTVVNNKFSEITGSFNSCVSLPGQAPFCPPYGIAIFVPNVSPPTNTVVVGGNNANELNTFLNVMRAVEVTNLNALNVTKNTFSCTSTSPAFTQAAGSGLTGQYGVLTSNINLNLTINFNQFKNIAFAVFHTRNDNTSTVYNPMTSIQTNTMQLVGSLSYIARGIEVTDDSGNSIGGNSTVFIRNNYINGIRDYGIRVSYIKNGPVVAGLSNQNPTQIIQMIYSPSASGYGIYLFKCNNSMVSNNTIMSLGTANVNMHAIYLYNSLNSLVQCNVMNSITHGITIHGDCTGPYTAATNYTRGIISNSFYTTATGINLKSNAKLGQQGDLTHPTSNRWMQAASSYNLGQTRTDGSSLPVNSIFYTTGALAPTMHQTSGTAYANGTTILTATGSSPACPGPSAIEELPDPGETSGGGVAGRSSDAHFVNQDTAEQSGTEFKVYPNPNNGLFYIESGEPVKSITIRVMDLTGRVLLTRNVENFTKEGLDLSNGDQGLYTVEIINGNNTLYYKLIKN